MHKYLGQGRKNECPLKHLWKMCPLALRESVLPLFSWVDSPPPLASKSTRVSSKFTNKVVRKIFHSQEILKIFLRGKVPYSATYLFMYAQGPIVMCLLYDLLHLGWIHLIETDRYELHFRIQTTCLVLYMESEMIHQLAN